MLPPPSLLYVISSLLLCPPVLGQTSDLFRWDQLQPSTDLKWVECYSLHQCARLQVPLDYSDPSVGTAALAIIRLPANVSKEEHRGPVFFNPGGPGGSGVDTLVEIGLAFTTLLGNQRDIVSFDPRGVSYSTPTISFFENDVERALWNAASPPLSLNASSDAIQQVWGRAQLQGQLAAQRDTSGILKYMTTDNTARDMLLISQKFGFEKLQYYGVSYGSVLGATFAALFPDKVERIIIDGVLDADEWYKANLTSEGIETDKVLQTFFDGCAEAGPDLCAFYKPTAAEIADRLSALTAFIRAQPVPVITPTSYGLVDYSFLRWQIFQTLYAPYVYFPALAESLAALERGNGTMLYELLGVSAPFECDCGGANDTVPFHLNSGEAVYAIRCGDAVEVTDSIEQLAEYYNDAVRSTTAFQENLVAANRFGCDGWRVHREGRFVGPVAGNTSVPLLFVTTSADPVTPKEGALNTLAGFPGSVLLTQDSPGHSSLTTSSLCTHSYFKQYLDNGTLPEAGTVCPVEARLFGAPNNSTGTRRAALSPEEEQILAAQKAIGDAVRPVIVRGLGIRRR